MDGWIIVGRLGLFLVVLGVLGIFAALPFIKLLDSLIKGSYEGDVGLRGRWGGFGGGRAGWQMSRNLTLLFLTVVFGGSFASVGAYGLHVTRSAAENDESKNVKEKLKEIEDKIDRSLGLQLGFQKESCGCLGVAVDVQTSGELPPRILKKTNPAGKRSKSSTACDCGGVPSSPRK